MQHLIRRGCNNFFSSSLSLKLRIKKGAVENPQRPLAYLCDFILLQTKIFVNAIKFRVYIAKTTTIQQEAKKQQNLPIYRI